MDPEWLLTEEERRPRAGRQLGTCRYVKYGQPATESECLSPVYLRKVRGQQITCHSLSTPGTTGLEKGPASPRLQMLGVFCAPAQRLCTSYLRDHLPSPTGRTAVMCRSLLAPK